MRARTRLQQLFSTIHRGTVAILLLVLLVLASLLASLLLLTQQPDADESLMLPLQSTPRATHTSRSVLEEPTLNASLINSTCLLDGLVGAVAPVLSHGKRYLVYAPQFGLSNQLVSLRNAVIWALLLNRTLVLPHLLGHGSVDIRVAHGAAFDTAHAVAAVAPLEVIEMDEFLRLGMQPAQVLELPTKTKYSVASDAYFRALGPMWHPVGQWPLFVPLRGFSMRTIVDAFGGCIYHRVLAFQSLFASFDVRAFLAHSRVHGCVEGEGWRTA